MANHIHSHSKQQSDGIHIYIHYPFCISKCRFCAFPTTVNMSKEIAYHNSLIRHISQVNIDRPILSIYFGGGSPSLMNLNQLSTLISQFRTAFVNWPEITVEVKPEHCCSELFDGYSSIGVTRVSIGAQSLLPSKLLSLDRNNIPKNFTKPKGLITSIDIIIGTKYDDHLADKEVEELGRLMPDHISIYPLSIEPGSYYHDNKPDFLSKDIGRQYCLYQQLLSNVGYEKYEYSNYRINTTATCVHTYGYWVNDDFIGFGVGANSKIRNISWRNETSMNSYINCKNFNITADKITLNLCDTEYAEQTLFMGLRLCSGINLDRVYSKSSNNTHITSKINKLLEHGYVTINNNIIKMNRPADFQTIISMLGWHFIVSNGWRVIAPKRLISA